jgi:hypothetical protein
MNWLQFFAALIGAVAWPVTLIVGFFILKSHLSALFPFIEKLRYKDFELEFRKSLQDLSEKSRGILASQEVEILPAAVSSRDKLYSLAEISPRSAILEAWLQVETAAAETVQRLSLAPSNKVVGVAPLRLGDYLRRGDILNPAQMEIFNRLRELRNKAVHIGDATFQLQEVMEYIDLASSLAAQISGKQNTP